MNMQISEFIKNITGDHNSAKQGVYLSLFNLSKKLDSMISNMDLMLLLILKEDVPRPVISIGLNIQDCLSFIYALKIELHNKVYGEQNATINDIKAITESIDERLSNFINSKECFLSNEFQILGADKII